MFQISIIGTTSNVSKPLSPFQCWKSVLSTLHWGGQGQNAWKLTFQQLWRGLKVTKPYISKSKVLKGCYIDTKGRWKERDIDVVSGCLCRLPFSFLFVLTRSTDLDLCFVEREMISEFIKTLLFHGRLCPIFEPLSLLHFSCSIFRAVRA